MIRHGVQAAAAIGLLAVGLLAATPAARAQVKSPTLDAVKQRGQLVCGIDTGIPGYAFQNASGEWQGLDVAWCRAIADAVLGSGPQPVADLQVG